MLHLKKVAVINNQIDYFANVVGLVGGGRNNRVEFGFNSLNGIRGLDPGRILDVGYNELIQHPEMTLRRITEFCGLEYVPGMLDTSERSRSVTTASAIQVRSKPALPPRPKWSSYSDYLTPLIRRLSDAGLL